MVFVQTHTSEQVVTYRKGAVKKPVQVKINLSSETCKQMQIRGIRKVSAADCTRCQHVLLHLGAILCWVWEASSTGRGYGREYQQLSELLLQH